MRLLFYSFGISMMLVASIAQADVIDLTTAGASDSDTAAIGGTFRVLQVPDQSTGTGVIEPFLRIQANGNEMGYNTDANPEYDAKAGTWTHALLLADVPIKNIGGTNYYEFLLDINQNSGGDNEFLSLNQIQLFRAASDVGINSETITGTLPPAISFSNATEVFRMNNANTLTHEIKLNYALNAGSGSGDMYLYVDQAAVDAAAGAYLVMFSHFGAPPGAFGSNDGFEEWAVVGAGGGGGGGVVPEPSSVLLLASVVAGVGLKIRRAYQA